MIISAYEREVDRLTEIALAAYRKSVQEQCATEEGWSAGDKSPRLAMKAAIEAVIRDLA